MVAVWLKADIHICTHNSLHCARTHRPDTTHRGGGAWLIFSWSCDFLPARVRSRQARLWEHHRVKWRGPKSVSAQLLLSAERDAGHHSTHHHPRRPLWTPAPVPGTWPQLLGVSEAWPLCKGWGVRGQASPAAPPSCQHTRQDLLAAPGLPSPSATLSLQELAGTPRLDSSPRRV